VQEVRNPSGGRRKPVAGRRSSSLTLLVPGIRADDIHHPAATHDLAVLADPLDWCSYLHRFLPRPQRARNSSRELGGPRRG